MDRICFGSILSVGRLQGCAKTKWFSVDKMIIQSVGTESRILFWAWMFEVVQNPSAVDAGLISPTNERKQTVENQTKLNK